MCNIWKPLAANFLIAGFLIGLAGCASGPVKQHDAEIYWPKPPEIPRYVYEGTLRSSATLQEKDTANQLRSMVTGAGKTDQLSFSKPFDVAARNGKIVVTDSVYRIAVMFDIPRRKVYPFGHRGDGKGQGMLKKPIGVGMDGKQWTYIADVSEQDVKVFDPLGMYIKTIGNKDVFQRPIDVAANEKGDRIYVLDAGGINSEWHRVIVFDGEGNKLKEIGRRGFNAGEFNLPTQLAVVNDGTLYVLDAGNFRVQAFSPEGDFLRSWGKVGRNLGDFARPRGIAVDSGGNVYVSDGAFRNFQIFNSEGKLLMFIGEPGLEDKPGQYVLPAGIAIDETDRIYVVDQLHHKVDVIRKLSEQEISQIMTARNMGQKPQTAGIPVDSGEAVKTP
ncbi:MAG: 6-bladed beta-propeller [Gammaproteobacteria bacterium]|nr:6-bladed beta-propeller [Gammaproteobacteria bacterium]